MTGYGRTFRHGNFHVQSQRPTQIACRICDRVFMNSSALIDHIDSHKAEDLVGATSQRNLSNLMPSQPLNGPVWNPLQLSLSPPRPSPFTRPSFKAFLNPNRFNLGVNPTSFTKRPVQVSRGPFYLMGKKLTSRGPHGAYFREAQDYGVVETTSFEGCTRPFLQQLDKPISYESEKIGDHNNNNSTDLDLSLKL